MSSRVENVLRQRVQSGDHLVVALSGGVDSVVLLNLLASFSSRISFSLSAIHVDHGISPNASRWAEFCSELCRAEEIPLKISKVRVLKQPGTSLEASARDQRYFEFGTLEADYVVLAQHQDDQAETLLLQLLRGAGVKGLGSMPVVRDHSPGSAVLDTGAFLSTGKEQRGPTRPKLLRPMLEVSRREIEDYAEEHRLSWISDESNIDLSFDRNFLRHQIFPLLERRFPGYRQTLSRVSRHMAETSILLDELAEADGKGCAASGRLEIAALRKLSLRRAKNLLRYSLVQQGAILPSTAKLDDLLRQLMSSRPDSKMHVIFGDTEIRCFRGELHVRKARNEKDRITGTPTPDWQLKWNGEEQLEVRELGGIVRFSRSEGVGINLQKLVESPVWVRPRRGGERLRPHYNRPRRSLKNLLREAGLPHWERQRLPLIFSGEHLVCVPGIGVDSDYQAAPGEQGLVVSWHRDGG
ncbi:MAG TPA: tRNA lysidine(34) synthetase TilS [Nitrosospira sp.]|nr:tRNA lysidine(34) synthetase TilS [Nitrosospira sp.]